MSRVLFAASLLLSFSSIALADMVIPVSPGSCSKLTGNWGGHGTATAGPITCSYRGTAVVRQGLDAGTYETDIELTRTNSNVMCPDEEVMTLPLVCKEGVVVLKTDAANLSGVLNESSTSANVTGTVKFTRMGIPVTAKITEMVLNKK